MSMKTQLTKEQQAIVDARAGLVTVDAGAGVGKTTTLMERVRSLIEEGTPANQIVALSYTRESARDMRDKVSKILGDEIGGNLHSRTIHSFGLSVLRTAEHLGITKHFQIVSEETSVEQARDIILNVMSEKSIKELSSEELFKVCKVYGDTEAKQKKALKKDGFIVAKKRGEKAEISSRESGIINDILKVVDIYFMRGVEPKEEYERDLRLSLGFTGKTLVQIGGGFYYAQDIPFMESIRALSEVADGINDGNGDISVRLSSICTVASRIYNEDIAAKMFGTPQLPYLMVDEAQDIDDGQIALINAINAKSLFIVGDTNQSLYAFRYVVPEVIKRSEELFPNYAKNGAVHLELTMNFRCPAGVIEHANELISCNGPTKELTASKDGYGVSVIAGDDYNDYIDKIVSSIKDLVSQGVAFNDIAIISRYFRDLTDMEPNLVNHGIPVRMRRERSFSNYLLAKLITGIVNTQVRSDSPQSFYDVIAYLNESITPKIKFGANAKREFDETIDRGLTVTESLKRLLDTKVLEDETGVLRELSEMMVRYRDMVDDDISPGILCGYIVTSELVRRWIDNRKKTNDDAENTPEQNEDEFVLSYLSSIAYNSYDNQEFVDMLSVNMMLPDGIDDAVTMSTAHASKGLEWDYVFCLGFESMNFPTRYMTEKAPTIQPPKTPHELQSTGDLNEERRMAYVMMTRPRKKLFMTWTSQKREEGKTTGRAKEIELSPSMFFMEAGINSGFESMTFKGKRKLVRGKTGKLTSSQK